MANALRLTIDNKPIGHLRVAGSEPGYQEFTHISDYHAHIISRLGELKAKATVLPEKRERLQAEFMQLALPATAENATYFLHTIKQIAASGLTHYSRLILSGSSLLLGGDEEGRFFLLLIDACSNQYQSGHKTLKLTGYRPKKGDHGIFIGNVRELFEEMQSFCHDHILFKNMMNYPGKNR